jgi:L-rhamnose mutarotase
MRNILRLSVMLALVTGVFLLAGGCACARPDAKHKADPVKRYGSVIGLKADKIAEYKKLHAAVWPDVLKMIRTCNIRNYSIYLMKAKDNEYYLFSYFEYVGKDFKADMAKMAADPTTQKWWELCKPCQEPLPIRAEGDWWANLEEVFHCD